MKTYLEEQKLDFAYINDTHRLRFIERLNGIQFNGDTTINRWIAKTKWDEHVGTGFTPKDALDDAITNYRIF